MGNENSVLNQDANFHPAKNEVQNKVHNEVQNLPSHRRFIRKVNDELDYDITVTYYEDHENNSNNSNDKGILLVINEKDTNKNIYQSTTVTDSSGCCIKDEELKDLFVNQIKNGCNFDGNVEGDVKTSTNFPGELISHNQGCVVLPDGGNNFVGTDEDRTEDDEWFFVDSHHHPNNKNLEMSNGEKLQTQDVHIQGLAEEDFHKNQETFKKDETVEKVHGIKHKYHEENEKKLQTAARVPEDIDLQYVDRHENKQERKEEYHLDVHAEERHLDVVENQNKKAESYAHPKSEYSEKLDSHDHLKTKSAEVYGVAEEIVGKEHGIYHEKPKYNQMEYKEYLHHLDENMKGNQESNTNDDTDREGQTKDEERIVEQIGHNIKTENDKNRKTETKVSLSEDIVVEIETKLSKVPYSNIELENPKDVQDCSDVEAYHKKEEKHVLSFEKRNYRETEDNVSIKEDYIPEANEKRNNTEGEEWADAENEMTLPEGYNTRNNELEHCSKHEKQKNSQLKYKEGVHYLDDNKEDKQESNTNEDIERECQAKDEKCKVEEIYYTETENNQNRKIKDEILVVEDVAVKRGGQLVEVPRMNIKSDNNKDAKGHSDSETNRKEEEEHILCYEINMYHSEKEGSTNIRADSIQNPNKEKPGIKEEKNADTENEMTLREENNVSDHKVEHCSEREKQIDLHIERKKGVHHIYNNTVDKQESNTLEGIEKEQQTKDVRNKVEEIRYHAETENNNNMTIKKELSEEVAVKTDNLLEEDLCRSIKLDSNIELKHHSEVETNNKKEEQYLLYYEKEYDKQTEGNANNEADSIQETNELKVNIKEGGHVNMEAKLKLRPEYKLISSEVKHCAEHENQADFQMEYKESVHHVVDNREGEMRIQEDDNVCDNEKENCSGDENQTSFQIECKKENWHHEDVNTNKKHASKINEDNKKESRKELLFKKFAENENNISLDEYGRAEIEDHNVDDNMDIKQKSNTNEDTKVECQKKDKKSKVKLEEKGYAETKNNDNMPIGKETSLTEEVAVNINNPLEEDPSLNIDLENDIDVKMFPDVKLNHKEEEKSTNQMHDGETFEADCIQEKNGLKINMKLEGGANLETELKLIKEHHPSSEKVKHCAQHEKQKDFQVESKENCSADENQKGFQMKCNKEDSHHENVNTKKKQESKARENAEKQPHNEIIINQDVEIKNEISLDEYATIEIEDQVKGESSMDTDLDDPQIGKQNCSYSENDYEEYHDEKLKRETEHNQETNEAQYSIKKGGHVVEKPETSLWEDYKMSTSAVEHHLEEEEQMELMKLELEKVKNTHVGEGYSVKENKDMEVEAGLYDQPKNHGNFELEHKTEQENGKEQEKQVNIELGKHIMNKSSVNAKTNLIEEVKTNEYIEIETEHKARHMECIHAETGTRSLNHIHIPTEKEDITKDDSIVESDIIHNKKFVCSNRDTLMLKETENILQNRDIVCSTDREKVGKQKETSNNLAEVQQLNDIAEVIDVAPASVEPVFFYEVRQSTKTYAKSSLEIPQRKDGFLEHNDQVNNKVGNASESNFPLNEELNGHNENDIQVDMVDNEVSPKRAEKNHKVAQIKHQIEEENHGHFEIVKSIDTDDLKNEGVEIHSPDIGMEKENNRENVKLGQHIERKHKVQCKEGNQTEEDFHEDIKFDHESNGNLPAQKEDYTKAEIHEHIVLENNQRNEHYTDVKTGFKVKHGDLAEIESQEKDETYIETLANHCSEDERHVHVEKENHLEDKNHEDNEKGVHIELEKHKDIAAVHEIEKEYVSNKSEKRAKYQDYEDAKINISAEVISQDSEKQYLEKKHEIKNDEYIHNNMKYQLQSEHLTKNQTLLGISFNHSNTGKSMLVEKCFKNGIFSFPVDHEAEEKHITNSSYTKQVQQHGEDLEVFDVTPLYLEPIFSYEIKETEDVCVQSNLDTPKEKINEPMLQAEKYQKELWVDSGKYGDIKIFQPEMLDQINPTKSHAVINNRSTAEYVTVAEETTASEVTAIHQSQTEKRKGELKTIIESDSTTDGDNEMFIEPNFRRRNLSSINKVSNDDLNMFEGSFNSLTILEELKLMESNLELDLDAEEIAARETLFMSQENIKISFEPESSTVLESDASFVPSQKVDEKTVLDESKSKNPHETPKTRQKSRTGRKSPKIRKSPKHQKKISSDSSLDRSNLSDEDDIRKDENILPENKQRPRRKISSFRRGRNKHPSNTRQLRFRSCGPLVRCGKAED